MRNNKQVLSVLLLCFSFFVLILDAKTALTGAKEGVQLCVCVVVPSLFPFLFLSVTLPSRLLGKKTKLLGRLGRLCSIPEGAESLMMLGFLGGYPVGAGMIADAYRQGSISRTGAIRMLGFCSNAGPAFIFGMVGSLFCDKKTVWMLWLIHILSALLVGIFLPDRQKETCVLRKKETVSFSQAMDLSIKTMANICGWVIIFRVIMSVLNRWILWLLPKEANISILGLLELTNGISYLKTIDSEAIRFIMCSGMLAFGGVCVLMQTKSVTKELGLGKYFPGKVLQSIFSILLSILAQNIIFDAESSLYIPAGYVITLIISLIVVFFFLNLKKSSSISGADIV